MGYDYQVNGSPNYLSYNHGWAFYKYVDEKSGFRFLYGKPLIEVVGYLQKMLEQIRCRYPKEYQENFTLQEGYDVNSWKNQDEFIGLVATIDNREVRYDGWAKTVGNVYYFASELLLQCQKEIIAGNSQAIISGD